MTARQLHRTTPLWPTHGNDQNGPPPWTHDAPCRRDPDLWFSEKPADVEAAKAACLAECPLKRVINCMDYAFDNGITWGVWGGVSRDERVEKRCADCKEIKLLGEFHRSGQSADARQPVCKLCAAAMKRRRWAATRTSEVVKAGQARRHAALVASGAFRTRKAEAREVEFAKLRERGLSVSAASKALSMTRRNGSRYETRRVDRLRQQEVAA